VLAVGLNLRRNMIRELKLIQDTIIVRCNSRFRRKSDLTTEVIKILL
jgi:hypothetical protein